MDIDRDRDMMSDADRESGIDRDTSFGGGMTPGGNPAQDQPGFDQDAAADTYPTRDRPGVNQGPDEDIDQGYSPPSRGHDPNVAQGPGVGPGVDQDMGQGPAYGSGMDQGAGMGGGLGSTDYDQTSGANAPAGGGGMGDAMQRARGKIEETVGRMTNNPDLQQQGIDRQAQAGGQSGYDTTGATDTTDTTGTTNHDLTDDTYGNP